MRPQSEASPALKCNSPIEGSGFLFEFGGVADGTRTHDDQNHNLGLYQLSYGHH